MEWIKKYWLTTPMGYFLHVRKKGVSRAYMYLLIGLVIGLIIALFRYNWL